jgi:hypothetical protein
VAAQAARASDRGSTLSARSERIVVAILVSVLVRVLIGIMVE